jgi:hypothetical protein
MFPTCTPVRSEIVTSPNTQAKTLWKSLTSGQWVKVYVTFKRWLLPIRGIKEWKKAASDILNIFRHYQETCIILKKTL